MAEVINILNPERVERVAGAGNKFLHLVDDLSDYYINLVPGLKCWDMCASEAIINSRLGFVTDANLKPLQYKE